MSGSGLFPSERDPYAGRACRATGLPAQVATASLLPGAPSSDGLAHRSIIPCSPTLVCSSFATSRLGRCFLQRPFFCAVISCISTRTIDRPPTFLMTQCSRSDGVLRIIERGDGQMSDRQEWSAERFAWVWGIDLYLRGARLCAALSTQVYWIHRGEGARHGIISPV